VPLLKNHLEAKVLENFGIKLVGVCVTRDEDKVIEVSTAAVLMGVEATSVAVLQ
jgi:hypothetical protein